MAETNEAQLASFLRAAAIQRRYLEPRRHDRRVLSQDGKILHAVDTDIVKLYTSPWEKAPHTKRRKEGYAEVFPGEEKDVVIAMGTALAEYIFHTLTDTLPVIMLPPLGEEMQNVFNAVSRNAELETQRIEARVQAMRQLMTRVDETEAEAATQQLAKNASTIAAFLRGQDGALTELRRYGDLLKGHRIAPPDYLLNGQLIDDLDWREALEAPRTIGDRIRFHKLREQWFNRLKSEKSKTHANFLTDTDAQVLARVEWINHVLERRRPSDDPRERKYMVLITGDRAIFAAAAKHTVPGEDTSFADRYLRHPRAYLAERGVLNPPNQESARQENTGFDNQFDQWLDTFLGEFDPGTTNFLRRLKEEIIEAKPDALLEFVRPMVTTRPKVFTDFRRRWRAYTHHLVIDHSPSTLERELNDPGIARVKERYEALITRLETAIDKRVMETWGKCFDAVTEGSFALVNSRSEPQRSRNAPRLTFDRFENTEAFVRKVLAKYRPGELSADDWDRELQKVRDDDDTGYAFYLAYAYLFAAEEIWRVAAILSNRALAIAARASSKAVTGREAAYLRAVALRHSAHRMGELRAVKGMLDYAEQAYERDLDGYGLLKAGPCRFRSERIALDLTYHLYRLLPNPPPLPEGVLDLVSLRERIDHALAALETSTENEAIVQYTEHNLLVNWLMLELLRWWTDGDAPDLDAFARHYRALVTNHEHTTGDFPASYYVETIRLCAAWVVAPQREKHDARDRVYQHLGNDAKEKNSVMPYDIRRFELLLDLIEGRTRTGRMH